MKEEKTFTIKVFCGNCYKQSILTFKKGTGLDERGSGSDKSIKVDLPNGKWSIAECPKCGSMNLNKRF